MQAIDERAGMYYPLVGFYFTVTLPESGNDIDAAFQEVSGINIEMDLMDHKEGGNNNFVWKLPKPPKYDRLKLSRGVMLRSSVFRDWCQTCLINNYDLSNPIVLKNVTVMLLDPEGRPAMKWTFYNAYPVKWSLSDLDAIKNQILVETVELTFTYFDENIL